MYNKYLFILFSFCKAYLYNIFHSILDAIFATYAIYAAYTCRNIA